MEYSLFSRDAEEQGQIDACKELGMAMMAYAVPGRGMRPRARPILNYDRPRTMLKIKAYYGDR